MIGTLHAHCWRAIGRPKVVETAAGIKGWNEAHPEFALTQADPEWADGAPAGNGDGDLLLARTGMLRHRLVPRAAWGELELEFDALWSDYKTQTQTIDFTDMIEQALAHCPQAPGNPRVIFDDEAQDSTNLELAVLEQWGQSAEHVTLVYDPAQSLFGWRGSTQTLADAVPDIILDQSYRVPAAVQAYALGIIRRSSTYREAVYKPRAEEGEVLRAGWQLGRPEEWVEELDDPFAGPTMVLATCSYMLNKLIKELRARGIPYHNPYSPARWNPLRLGTAERVTACDRLLAFTGYAATGGYGARRLRFMAKSLAAPALLPGWRKVLDELPDSPTEPEVAAAEARILTPAARGAAAAGDLAWYEDALKTAHRTAAAYPLAVLRRAGAAALKAVAQADAPTPEAVIIGTIHSVKGGEANRVVLFPDLSPSGMRTLNTPGWLNEDSVYRMMYVGCTRARRDLVIGRPTRGAPACPL